MIMTSFYANLNVELVKMECARHRVYARAMKVLNASMAHANLFVYKTALMDIVRHQISVVAPMVTN